MAFSMTGLQLFLGFLSSTLFVDFETRFLLAFLLDSGLMQAQLVCLPRYIDILQTLSPLFGFDELKTRVVVSSSSLDVFVSSALSYLKVRKVILSKAINSFKSYKLKNTWMNVMKWSESGYALRYPMSVRKLMSASKV